MSHSCKIQINFKKISVGAPIDVVQSDQPDAAYVDKIHKQVIDDLEKMFAKYKDQYIPNSKQDKLIIH